MAVKWCKDNDEGFVAKQMECIRVHYTVSCLCCGWETSNALILIYFVEISQGTSGWNQSVSLL